MAQPLSSAVAPTHGVVVAVDGSSSSDRALAWAAGEADRLHRPLHVLHAQSVAAASAEASPYTGLSPSEAQQVLSSAQVLLDAAADRAQALVPDVEVSRRLVQRAPAGAVVEASKRAQTVVLGARGLGAVRTALLGSVSTQVAMHAHCPVVVIKDVEDPDRPRDGVVVGIDGSPGSQPVLGYAFEQASSRGTSLHVVHAWSFEHAPLTGVLADALSAEYQVEPEHQLMVSESLAGWQEKHPDVEVRASVVHALAVPTLLEHSDGAELLVVGSRGRGGFTGLVLGSVSHALLQRAGCPVAVVRGHR